MDNVSFAIGIARAMGSNRNSHPSGGLFCVAPLLLLSHLIGQHSDLYRTPFQRLRKLSDITSESLSDINRNRCPIWIGTSVRFESESVSDIHRNTQYRNDPLDIDVPNMVFALDSSIISLALNLFPWSYYPRTKQGALKLHLMLSLKGNLPAWAVITDTKIGDNRMVDQVPIYRGAHYIMDRGYMDFVRLFQMHQAGGYFVVRCKEPVSFKVLERKKITNGSGITCDQIVKLKSNWSKNSYPEPMRRIVFLDKENGNRLVFLTNNTFSPAEVIAELYKKRWQVELFFKWIKQHLRLRAFYGRSENAVRCQLWTAICAYLLVAILKKRIGTEKSLNEILQITSVGVFDQTPAKIVFSDDPSENMSTEERCGFQRLLPLNNL